jgi:glycosyltransferase involved in cell wall biosynthesis
MRSQLLGFVDPDHHGKLHVARVGMDPRRFQQGEDRVDGGPLRVLTVGRLSVRKGHAVLVEALARLIADGVDVDVTIVGEGEERPRLERMARELSVAHRLQLTGAVGQDDIPAYFHAADVFCLSSFAEGVPISLMEAMASGLPVVAPRLMGIPELVEDGVSGVLFAPARPDELANALRDLAGTPERRREMGAAGRARVVEQFDVRDCTRAIASLLAAAGGEPG